MLPPPLSTPRNDVLWVLRGTGTVYHLRPGSRRFERVDIGAHRIDIAALTAGADGRVDLFSVDDVGATTLRSDARRW